MVVGNSSLINENKNNEPNTILGKKTNRPQEQIKASNTNSQQEKKADEAQKTDKSTYLF